MLVCVMVFDSSFGRCSVRNVVAGYYIGTFSLCLFNNVSYILDNSSCCRSRCDTDCFHQLDCCYPFISLL